MISREITKEISNIVGPPHLITRNEDLTEYASDATKLIFMPDAAVFPGTDQEVSSILRLASQKGFPVIPRGAGSGMSGGALPVRGGLVMAMSRFNRILHIDRDNLVAHVEPGVITAELQRAVEEVDLFYPPDPASLHISTIGGNVAECAGGLRAYKYGVTRDYVLGLKVVLPTGEIIRTGVQTVKGVAGYDLTRLIVGSEGTLAVITAITLRLIPKPEAQKTMVAFFPNVETAALTVSYIVQAKIIPTILEFMDRLTLDCVRDEMDLPIPKDAGAMLLIEVDGEQDRVDAHMEKVRRACHQGGALHTEVATDRDTAERLWETRRKASPSLQKLRPNKINEDVVVPRTRLADLGARLDQLSREYGLPIPAFGHAGDGNIHVNIMLDQDKIEERQNAQKVVTLLFESVIRMGGTITGEHGVGFTKAPYLDMEIPQTGLDLMSRIKRAFDPRGILNPGKIFL